MKRFGGISGHCKRISEAESDPSAHIMVRFFVSKIKQKTAQTMSRFDQDYFKQSSLLPSHGIIVKNSHFVPFPNL